MENSISVRRTGLRIKKMLSEAGVGVRDLQKALGLACPQSIYRWFAGTALPTVDHLYTISRLLGVSVDDLLALDYTIEVKDTVGYRYMKIYYDHLFRYPNPEHSNK